MVFSYYIGYIPYQIVWRFLRILRKKKRIVLHIDSEYDLYLFYNIQKHLKLVDLVVTSIALKKKLENRIDKEISINCYPAFPDAVIMFRNAAWKYPVKKIIKIGMTHGAYNFKRLPKSYYYNMFDLFLMTSDDDVKRSQAKGVKTSKAIGYPKSDSLLNNTYNEAVLVGIRKTLRLDQSKKTLLFTATWDGSGMSAIDKWYNKLQSLLDRFNIVVNLHDKMSQHYRYHLQHQQGIHFIDQPDVYPYILIADVCITDTSSLIAEFCIADKPIVTFSVNKTERTLEDIIIIIKKVSISIDTFSQLPQAIDEALTRNKEFSLIRKKVIQTLISPLDGKAGIRAANEIVKLIPELRK